MRPAGVFAQAAASCSRPIASVVPRQPAGSSRLFRAPPAQQRCRARFSHASQRASFVCAASQTVGKFISKTPIPAFIPRQDLMDQLLRWAAIQASDPDALAKFDLPIKVTPYYKDGKNQLWGMSIAFVKDGVTATTIGVKFDSEEVIRHEWVGRGSDGFPTLEGNSQDILGANLEIRKEDDNAIDDDVRAAIRSFCMGLVAAINKYYAFGSAFVDEAT